MSEADREDQIIQKISASALSRADPKRLGVAVSGGGDSMALLDVLAAYAESKSIPISVVTVDHGLRSESVDEAAFVENYCAATGLSHSILKWEGWHGAGNLQASARSARYRLMAAWAKERDIDIIALGHTMDDQAETFLMRLARKSGVDGLAEMDSVFERDGVRWVRPFLDQSRATLRRYLKRRGINWIEDPSNDDSQFDRVKARQALVELAVLGIDAKTLSSVARNLRSAKRTLESYERFESERLVGVDRGDVIISRGPLPHVPFEIERRLINSAIEYVAGGDYAPRWSAIKELDLALIEADAHTLAGCLLTQSNPNGKLNRQLRITREYNAVKGFSCLTDALWDGRWSLDGPHAPDLKVRALGEALKDCPDWRETGLPRPSLLASPSIWRGETLVSAPLAGLSNGWAASATGRGTFAQFLLSR